MKFWKYHLNGNDFILIHSVCQRDQKMMIKMCDRHKGIGGDGVMFVRIQKGIVYYEHFNCDGSPAGMCGNGIRCVAHWFMSRKNLNQCNVIINDHEYHLSAYKDMITLESDFPTMLDENLYLAGVKHRITEEYVEDDEYNVDVVRYEDAMFFHIDTYELGVGETLSCGTGNLAAFYHGYLHNLLHRIAIGESKGGQNLIRKSGNHLYISGVAHCVYQGTWHDEGN